MIQHKRFNIAIYLGMLVIMLDQMSKWWLIHEVLPEVGTSMHINAIFNLVHVGNQGITFGLLNQYDPQITFYFLTITAGLILILLGRWLWRTRSTFVATGLGLVIGGAVGNVIDRLRFHAVIDFLDFHLAEHHWPAFNLADSAIVTGVAILLLDGLFRGR